MGCLSHTLMMHGHVTYGVNIVVTFFVCVGDVMWTPGKSGTLLRIRLQLLGFKLLAV